MATFQIRIRHYGDRDRAAGDEALTAYSELYGYNRMVANSQADRDAGLWLTPHELEKEFNTAKHVNLSLTFATEVSELVAQGACRNYRNAHSRWQDKSLKARRPAFRRKNRTVDSEAVAATMQLLRWSFAS